MNDGIAQARTVIGYIGSALIVVAAAKFAGINIANIRGDFWQIALMGMALRQV